MNLDHLVLAGPDLGALTQWWESSTGAPWVTGGAHVGLGTANALVGLSTSSYIELIGPDPDQPHHQGERPFGINDLIHNRLVTFAVAVASIDAAIAGAEEAGIEFSPAGAMERLRPDGVLLSWRLAFPASDQWGGVMPFFIEWGQETPHPTASLDSVCALIQLTLSHPQIDLLAQALGDAIGPVADSRASGAGLALELEAGPASLEAELKTPKGQTVLATMRS